ncbi:MULTISPECIES: DUF899 domain-containing protein [Gracilibacillus]|uniref:DUF899 domain-containing protein n=1 Tax=Gracilibacillus TaxID=74385 RepID=UPI00098EF82B|nr:MULTISPECIES: DUF899 domain-containing protein [Gracilibacillus]
MNNKSNESCCSINTKTNGIVNTKETSSRKIVSKDEWHASHQAFLEEEKAFTRIRDKLNAKRRRLPMVEVTKNYIFQGNNKEIRLYDLFAGHKQLIVYHFMFDPNWEEGCDGCSMMVDNMGHPAHLEARNTKLVLISRAPMEKIIPFKERMGWKIPWYSSYATDFNQDFGATTETGETHGYSVFLLENNQIYHTYSTWARGVEYLGSNWSYLDITPFGRQELWEDSPPGVVQSQTYEWWNYHDRYEE